MAPKQRVVVPRGPQKSFYETAWDEVKSSENRSIVRSIAVFGVSDYDEADAFCFFVCSNRR